MKRPKTALLYVIENERYGGGERTFAQLARGLDRSSYEVFAACLAGPNPGSAQFLRAVEGFAEIVSLDLRSLFSPGAALALRKIILDKRIDIVHSQGARADFYSRLAVRLAGRAALVSTVAAPVEEYDVGPLKKAVYTALDRFDQRQIDRFVAVAGHLAGKLTSVRGIPKERICRIYNGVELDAYAFDPEAARNARAKLGLGDEAFLAGAFCRLSPEKGLFQLVEAAKLTAEAGARITYLAAGGGPLEGALKARVIELGLEKNFIFAGFTPDVRGLMSAVNVVLLPSFREGFPVSVLEAMAAGKPVIASDIEGVRESVAGGQNGQLVPPGDPAALARALLAFYNDRALASALGARGRAIAEEKFGVKRMVEAHEALYREILL